MALKTDSQTATKGGIVLIVRFAVIAVLNYALAVILAWLLPKNEFGRVSTIQATLLLAAYALNSGFPWTLAWIEARRDRLNRDYLDAVFRTSLLGNLGFGVLLGLGFVLLQLLGVHILPDASLLLLVVVAASFPVFAVNAVAKGALHGRRQFGYVAVVQAAEVLVKCLVAVVLVVAFPLGAVAVAIAFLIGALTAFLLGASAFRNVLPRPGPLAGLTTYRAAVPMFLGSAGFALFSTLDVIGLHAVGHRFGVTAATVAVYQVAALVARAPYFVGDAMADAVFPFIARQHTVPTASHAWFGSAARWTLLAVVPLQVIIVLRPDLFLELFFPPQYETAAPLIRLIGVGTIGMIGCTIYGKTLQALGRRDAAAKVMPGVLLVELSLLTLLVPKLAATGAAIAFSTAAWTGAVLLAVTYHRHQAVGPPHPSLAGRYILALLALVPGLTLGRNASSTNAVALVTLAVFMYVAAAHAVGLVTPNDVAGARRLAERIRWRPWATRKSSTTALTTSDALTGELVARRSVDDVQAPRDQSFRRIAQSAQKTVSSFAKAVVARPLVLGFALFVLSLGPFMANITTSPDTQFDEVVYTRASQLVASTGQLAWTNEPVFVHPPLYFLMQSAWLSIRNLGEAPLFEAIHAARLLTAALGGVNAALLGILAFALTSVARPWRRLLIVGAVVTLAATDPVLLRYSRLAIIEPLALVGCLVTLIVSWHARRWSGARHVLAVGLLTGLTLLIKEVSVFLLVTPIVFSAMKRDWSFVRRACAALAIGFGVWLLFPLWAAQLGAFARFWEVKLFTLERLLGLLQVTGWNRPGASFTGALMRSAPQYFTSYLLLFVGAVALLWLFFRRNKEAATYVLALLLCSYMFAAYIVTQGTLNEQFFIFIMPAAILGSVLGLDALMSALYLRTATRSTIAALPLRVASGCAVGVALLVVLGAVTNWRVQYASAGNNGIEQMARFIDARYPRCATFNASGDVQKYAYSLRGRTVTQFASGAGALGRGVHLFFLNPKDAVVGYGRMSPELANWIRTNGSPLAAFPSLSHGGVQLWEVKSDQFDPAADNETIDGGVFVHTVGSRCGGYQIKDDPNGLFLREYGALGGKAVVGAPISRRWNDGERTYQAFNSVVLATRGAAPGRPPAVRPSATVAALASQSPDTYRRYQLPPIQYTATADPEVVHARLNDVRIARAYLGVTREGATDDHVTHALTHLGAPLGPAVRMPDGAVRQAFEKVVYERPPTTPDVVRMAPVGRAMNDAMRLIPAAAAQSEPPPPVLPTRARIPSNVLPFVGSFAALLLCYAAVTWWVVRRVRRRQNLHAPVTATEQRYDQGSVS
jgi:O-antigen/teichoic acid export membrane protein/4-amino-4-deoxy-L-arabinose transferase-like glycosyltransferase